IRYAACGYKRSFGMDSVSRLAGIFGTGLIVTLSNTTAESRPRNTNYRRSALQRILFSAAIAIVLAIQTVRYPGNGPDGRSCEIYALARHHRLRVGRRLSHHFVGLGDADHFFDRGNALSHASPTIVPQGLHALRNSALL